MVLVRTVVYVWAKSFSPLRKTGSDSNVQTNSDRLFQTDAAAAGKAWLLMVACRMCGETMADVLEECMTLDTGGETMCGIDLSLDTTIESNSVCQVQSLLLYSFTATIRTIHRFARPCTGADRSVSALPSRLSRRPSPKGLPSTLRPTPHKATSSVSCLHRYIHG